ncbi:uncharacterized protein LOC132936446 [Metopolophium dirhodum]|uniref:uncharacterized protein LOC132936446 n=1 Tax=Metopolophium dirhodum TaxID=44670 RepID=UPI002990295A|nr:uncharacterized protein LOC132936446 [Metopolophium dirhodum]
MAEEEPRKKVNTYIINTIPKPKYNVQFKLLPFYKYVYKFMAQPEAIYCIPIYKPGLKQPQEHTIIEYEFELPKLIEKIISEKKNNVQLQIRFGKELLGMSELSEELPEPITFYINSHKGTAKNSPIDYYCSVFKLLSDTKNKITILWPHCKTPYYIVINIVESITIEDLVKQVQFNNKIRSITLNTKAKITEFLKNTIEKSGADGCDMATLDLSLLCPITKLKMKLPARSMKCNHLQSFDLRGLFALNKIKPTWKCPVCNIPILVDELVLDSFLLDVINTPSVPGNDFQIIIHENGSWESYKKPKEETKTPKTNDCNGDDSEPIMIN